jgi:AAA lid domain
LFIDEAYSLARPGGGFGQEAIDTLVKLMEDHRDELVVIVAGYEDEMKDFMGSNPGLPSRFPRAVHFPDFTNEELVEIFENMCDYDKYVLSADAKQILRRHLESMTRTRTFGNGRLMRNIFEAALARQASRIIATKSSNLTELVPADLPLPASMAATEGTTAKGKGGDAPGPSRGVTPKKRARAFTYMLRAYAGEEPECDAETAAFVAGMVRGLGRDTLQLKRGMTKEQADAAFLQWVRDQHASWESRAAMGDAAAGG